MYLILALITFIPSIFCENKLIHVHAIWRHGERNPVYIYKGDLNNASTFPDGLGRLTKNGIHQLFTLGKHFQARYIYEMQFLSRNYNNSEVYSQSTASDRTMVSAMAFFSGLYSNATTEDHILAPIPIHTIPSENDFLFLQRFHCQRMNELRDIANKSFEMHQLYERFQDLLNEVANKTHTPVRYRSASAVFDGAVLEERYGLPLPEWVRPRIPEWKRFFVNYILIMYGFIPFSNSNLPFNPQLELMKISGGPLMAEIADRLILKIKCLRLRSSECADIRQQKLYTYSGHDITIVEIFAGLGFKTFSFKREERPSMGSSVVLELWENENIRNSIISKKTIYEYYYVKIYYYQNSSVENPKYIGDLIPECQGRKGCPISYLFKRAELFRPKPNLKSYCNQFINAGTKETASFGYLYFSVIFLFCKFILSATTIP